jgi:nucleoside-diphosphate-sugar epimerase
MALVPLAAAAQRMAEGGWLVVMSSSAVEDLPERWLHYAVAKSAVEAVAAHCARRRNLKVLVARAPKMWTEMSNGPLGRTGTVATEQVASAIVSWVLGHATAEPFTVLGSRELAAWSPSSASWQTSIRTTPPEPPGSAPRCITCPSGYE